MNCNQILLIFILKKVVIYFKKYFLFLKKKERKGRESVLRTHAFHYNYLKYQW